MNTLHEMFEDGIKDVYNAEKQLLKALPKFGKLAKSQQLKQAFETHLGQTEEQCRRLEQAAQLLGFKPTGMVCAAMKGLVEEGNEHTKGLKPSAVTDAELIALAQKNEHYEIATYGTLCTWAKEMGHNEVLTLLKQNLNEEEETDKLLTQIAEGEVNRMALEESNQMNMGQNGQKNGRSGGSKAGGSQSKTGGTRKAAASKSKSPRGRASVM